MWFGETWSDLEILSSISLSMFLEVFPLRNFASLSRSLPGQFRSGYILQDTNSKVTCQMSCVSYDICHIKRISHRAAGKAMNTIVLLGIAVLGHCNQRIPHAIPGKVDLFYPV